MYNPLNVSQEIRESLEFEMKSWINSMKDIKKLNIKCTSVELIKDSPKKYIGMAEFNNSQETQVMVLSIKFFL